MIKKILIILVTLRQVRLVKLAYGVLILLFVIIFLTSCSDTKTVEEVVNGDGYKPVVSVQTIVPGGAQVFSVLGEVQSEQSADLTAEFRADITSILVKSGDTVEKGQILLQLTSSSISSSAGKARESLSLARQSFDETLQSNKKSIQSAQVALESAELALKNVLNENFLKKKQAKETLQDTLTSLDLSIESSEVSLANVIRSTKTSIVTGINKSDEILGVSEIYDQLNDDFENQLGVLDNSVKQSAELALGTALRLRSLVTDDYSTVYAAASEVENVLELTLTTLNNTTTSVNLTQATLSGYIDTISAQLMTIRTQLAALDSADAALASASNIAEGSAEPQTVRNAKAAYESTIAALQTAKDTARKSVESARIALESVKRQANLSKTSADSIVTKSEDAYSQAGISLGKLMIKAPFSGVISDIPVQVGDEVLPNELLARVEDPKRLKITAYLTRSQIEQISIGDEVRIGESSADKITARSTTIDPATRKFKVEILHENPYLVSGQFINLEFTGKTDLSGDIILPLSAVLVTGDGDFVWVVNTENITTKQEVTLGEIRQSNIVITSGLKPGDQVIVSGGRLLKKENIEVEIENRTKK